MAGEHGAALFHGLQQDAGGGAADVVGGLGDGGERRVEERHAFQVGEAHDFHVFGDAAAQLAAHVVGPHGQPLDRGEDAVDVGAAAQQVFDEGQVVLVVHGAGHGEGGVGREAVRVQGVEVALLAVAADGQLIGNEQVRDAAAAPGEQVRGGLVAALVVVGGDLGGGDFGAHAVEKHERDMASARLSRWAMSSVPLATESRMPSTRPPLRCWMMATSRA